MKLTVLPLCAAIMGATLAACGGNDVPPEGSQAASARPLAMAAPASLAGDPVAPLLDEDGHAMPTAPAPVSSDSAANGRTFPVASAAQVDMLAARRAGDVLQLALDGDGHIESMSRDGQIVADGQPALKASSLVFVRAADLTRAAAAAERLVAQGVAHVWVMAR